MISAILPNGQGRLKAIGVAFSAVSLCAAALADAQVTSALKADVSRSAVTTMPAYSVEEAQSAKTHTLFMGADIAINLDKDIYRVRDVFGSNWVIEVNGQEKEVSARQAPVNLKITPKLKLTEVSATITGYRQDQAYTFNNDPRVRLTRGLSQAASMSNDLKAIAENAQHIADTISSNNRGGAAAGSWDQFSEKALEKSAQYTYSNSHSSGHNASGFPNVSPTAPTATGNTTGLGLGVDDTVFLTRGISQGYASAALVQAQNGNEPTAQLNSAGYDALDVEFYVRSGKTLREPYVVTIAQFHAAGSPPGMVQKLVYAQALHPIDEHQSHVQFSESGFPIGYEMVDFQLHLYNRGDEIATNVATDRQEMTREQAFEYVRSEFIGAHSKATIPAVPVMGKLPGDLHAQLLAGKYAAAFYVKVSPDGLANKSYADPACTQRIDDPYLDSVVKRIRFKPALNNGKPVDGVASLNLSQLKI
jgi:hypothetical protein